ncbi:hypothetical protein H0484_06830 [Pusillimonas sp. CC-YST705]|uniref:Extradiol ring-cleavage dioxygenase LigAB LigA subunit domain-containing protein n=1 Tax=Mesopusillimonas faecipullorum TaxID=2755040 RepID=A0ABS8CBQ1_9BURK|nr:hypothetical protein [Mesopusillimonas faecipullorum]MCB5363460.1 hypothetical protein [Mesopusillimonas faecipullorum]
MGIQNVDKTLPSNQMVFDLRRDADKYHLFQQDIERVMQDYGLTQEERMAWRGMDISRLAELGVHPYFLPQISRLFKGGGYNHNDSDAARLYAEKMGISQKES